MELYSNGVMLSAAYCLQWWAEEVNKDIETDKVYKILTDEAAKIPAGSEGLIFLPYLTGERTPMQMLMQQEYLLV